MRPSRSGGSVPFSSGPGWDFPLLTVVELEEGQYEFDVVWHHADPFQWAIRHKATINGAWSGFQGYLPEELPTDYDIAAGTYFEVVGWNSLSEETTPHSPTIVTPA